MYYPKEVEIGLKLNKTGKMCDAAISCFLARHQFSNNTILLACFFKKV